MSKPLRQGQLLHLAAIAAMLGLSAWAWGQLPPDARVPTHWNLAGDVDGTSGKAQGLLFAPLLSLAMLAVFTALPALEPRREHLAASADAYAVVWGGVAVLLGIVHGGIVLAALGHDVPVDRAMPLLVGGLFLALAWAMPRIQSNFMLGIRTPWTLSSEHSWRRTHAAGRWVFGGVGLAMMAMALVGGGEQAFAVVIGGAVASALALVAYSYAMWRQDPAR